MLDDVLVDDALKQTVPLLMAVDAARSTTLTAMLVRFRTVADLRFNGAPPAFVVRYSAGRIDQTGIGKRCWPA